MRTGAALTILTLTAFMAGGCSKSVEKMREEQDARLSSDGHAVVEADYYKAYEAHPDDPAALYLYARLVEDTDKQAELAKTLTSKNPSFAWGHFLVRSVLQQQGDYAAALGELKKAASLAPDSKFLQTALIEEADQLVVVHAENGGDLVGKMPAPPGVKVGTLFGVLQAGSFWKADDLDHIRGVFAGPSVKGKALEVLAATMKVGDKFVIKVFAKNTTSTSIVLDEDDVKHDNAVACFKSGGKRVLPDVGQRQQIDQDQCRACETTIKIPPGAMGRPHAVIPGDLASFERCVFYNLPTKGSVVQVNLGGS